MEEEWESYKCKEEKIVDAEKTQKIKKYSLSCIFFLRKETTFLTEEINIRCNNTQCAIYDKHF